MRGQAQAALEAKLPVQYCMALPADILQSVEFPAVTNARASEDYGAGGGNWNIGGSSLLLSALGLRGSKDNFWTGPRNSRGQETSPFLVAAVATLSGGPVGFADPLFGTNPAVLWPTCTSNGTILHASRPATLVDAFLSAQPDFAGWGVTVAHSQLAAPSLPSLRAYSIFAPSRAASVPQALNRTHLWPPPVAIPGVTDASARMLLWAFNASGCVQGGSASACLVELGTGGAAPTPLPAPTGDKVPWGLWNAVPLLANGYALLGETDKYIATSPARFLGLAPAPGGAAGLSLVLAGAPGEMVHLAFYRPNGASPEVAVKDLVLDGTGSLSATLV